MAYRPYIWRKNNPEKRLEQKRREKVRRRLRDLGILPNPGEPMNEEQKEIDNQISNNDFSYWDKIKSVRKPHDGGVQKKVEIKSPEYLLWYRAKERCKEKEITFDLSVDDIIIPEVCEITKQIISTDYNDRFNNNYYTLTPIEYSKGYVKDNVKVVSVIGSQQFYKSNEHPLRDYIPSDIVKSIFKRSKENSKRRGLDFNIEKSDIVVPTHCPYLGVELSYNKKDSQSNHYYTIDRIDSSKGYVKGNIQIISKLANTMKNEATIDQLLTFSKNVLETYIP